MPLLAEEDGAHSDAGAFTQLFPSPGKDPSRLLQDLIEHTFADPQIHTSVPYFDPTKPYKLPEPSHVHSWLVKSRESLKNRPWNSHYEGSYLVAACESCRMHLSLTAIITSEEAPPCGSREASRRSHHFHLESWTKNVRSPSPSQSTVRDKPELGAFHCCHCPLSLQIEFWQPIIPESLTSIINKRAMSSNSALNLINRSRDSRGSVSVATAYATLATYVAHALNGQAKNIQLQPDSPLARRVGTAPEIINFMSSLGWEVHEDYLTPPQWDEELHKGRLRRKILEHAEIELVLTALEAGRGIDNKEKVNFDSVLYRGERDMAKLMTAPWPPPGFEYKSEAYFRLQTNLDLTPSPCFAALGTVFDVNEYTVIDAYKNQITDDPKHTQFYLECLQQLGSSLHNRVLNQYVESEFAKGIYTRFELDRAYKTLEIDDPGQIDDDGINVVFSIRCEEAPHREKDFKRAMQVIQYFKKAGENPEDGSSTPEKKEMTPNEAYRRLQITDPSVSDDMVISSFVSSCADYPPDRPKLREALQVLGKERNSLVIKSYLSEQNESQVAVGPINQQLSLDEAYIILGIEGGAQLDDTAVILAYNELSPLQPERTEEFKKAVETIADHRDSIPLKTFLIDIASTPDKQKPGPGSAKWPVGLENIAQTCYMNSLFQYYFTVKPLREAVLSYEAHAEGDLTDEELKKKQISRWELQRSKRFIAQLRLLFQELITSNLAYIRPKEELVRLTLIDVKQEFEEETTKRRQSMMTNASQSILDSDIPDLVEIEDNSGVNSGICCPFPSPVVMAAGDDPVPEMYLHAKEAAEVENPSAEDADYEFVDHESADSAAVVSSDTTDPMSFDKENENKAGSAKRHSSDKPPLQERQEGNTMKTESKEDVEMVDAKVGSRQPSPPPIPQRPVPRRKSTWQPLKYGSQQDVTECITNCLSQLHAGFKPEEYAENGDHIDLFKKLFYIRVREVFRDLQAGSAAEPIDEKEENHGSMLHIYVDPEIGGSLYDAIDRSLGREKIEYKGVEDCEKRTTVTYLPPVLQFQIVRTQFNRSVGAGYKENAHLELESKIYMDRYIDPTDAELASRQDDYWEWKVELEATQRKKAELLKKRNLPMNPIELLSTARSYLEMYSTSNGVNDTVPTELLDGLSLYETQLKKQVDKLEKDAEVLKSRLKQQFTDRRQHGYRLHSVFIHRGDVTHGHYWIYIYDFVGNRWFKYNDESVTEVEEKVVFANDSAEGAGPYFLTYVKEDMANELVEVLKRDLSGNLMSF